MTGAASPGRLARAPVHWSRLALWGVGLALAVGVAGLAAQSWWLGWSDEAVKVRLQRDVRTRVMNMASSLSRSAVALASERERIRQTIADPEVARELFERAEALTTEDLGGDLAITVYNASGAPIAWSGRPSEIPTERIFGPRALFVAPGPLGLRLVHIEPVHGTPATDSDREDVSRLGSVAAERVLSPAQGIRSQGADGFALTTSLATVSLRTRYEGAGDRSRPFAFVVTSPSGDPLLEAEVQPAALTAARARGLETLVGVVLTVLALAVLVLTAPLLDWRNRARDYRRYLRASGGVALALLCARALLWLATPVQAEGGGPFSSAMYSSSFFGPLLLQSPAEFLLDSLTLLGLVALVVHGVWRLRIVSRSHRWTGHLLPVTAIQVVAGALAAVLLLGYERFIENAVESARVDILHFAIHPWDPARLSLTIGLLGFHAALVWGLVGLFVLAAARSRVPGAERGGRLGLVVAWTSPVVCLAIVALVRAWPVPALPMVLTIVVVVTITLQAARGFPWFRHASQASRLVALFVALLLPGLVMYPSVLFYGARAKRRLIETQYAVQAANLPQDLQVRLDRSLAQIDDMVDLPELAAASISVAGPPQTDSAFLIWRQTDLSEFRLTSAVELYGPNGALGSRFALNIPEYTSDTQTWQGSSCEWDISGEAAPFGSEERRLLHAERGICGASGEIVGALIVHVMLDYSALSFLSSQSPYFEFFRSPADLPEEGMPGRDVELVIYGWGRLPLYASDARAWVLDEATFARIYASREPFWTTRTMGDEYYQVYVSNDRAGIYALGYPVLRPFDVFVDLAEIASLAVVAYLTLLLGARAFAWLTARDPRSGRRLLQEIRQSFYRKLFLAFVAAAVVPVLILAVSIRTYFAALLVADVEAEAARTAAVAQRVIEESVALQRGTGGITTVGDDVMVWISQIIDQDVNIFDGPRLVATSERDLFASGLLPTRTPDDVYRSIRLQRQPSFVGEDAIGDFRYLLAAAPVRLGGRDAILTVPLALRQQEIDQETDELDRGVYLAVVVFVLLGAGIGFSMAERIGDPVQRLTRATRRIARGDFDARVAVKSADELQRLVEAFNRMAVELQEQRDQLERTHRLEAWAEMARQVAHEIKNPLTPIQLSAEHLQRVHADRGNPLSPVLESCLDSILTQVRLLRQIASEFSSFASAPTARRRPTPLGELVAEVLEPYRPALAHRIAITLRMAPDLPLADVDRTLIARALTNIVENALHAMPGSGALSVEVTPVDGRLRVVTTDTGVGMSQEALDRLFEPYFSTKATGTGLGLPIAKRNVELNDGTLDVRSTEGTGTIVIMTLPVAAVP